MSMSECVCVANSISRNRFNMSHNRTKSGDIITISMDAATTLFRTITVVVAALVVQSLAHSPMLIRMYLHM